jgi:hypothetical protein
MVIDDTRAQRLRAAWLPDQTITLEFTDCPDRRLTRCAAELVSREAEHPGTQVTAILPRRSFSPLLGRLLHDRTADKIAAVVSRVPNAAATIIPFDVPDRLHVLQQRHPAPPGDRQTAPAPDSIPAPGHHDRTAAAAAPAPRIPTGPLPGAGGYDRPAPSPGADPIGSLPQGGGRATVEGRVRALEIRPVDHNTVLAVDISDSTGDLTALFYGRSAIPGLACGGKVRLRGAVGVKDGAPVMINPAYELLAPGNTTGEDQ